MPTTPDNPVTLQEVNDSTPIVTVSSVTYDGTQAKYQLTDTDGIITDYIVRNKYHKNLGIYMNGVTSPTPFNGASVAFIQLSNPTLLWIAHWTACKAGAQPECPSKFPLDTQWILLYEYLESVKIETLADGQSPLYRLSGLYIYGHQSPDESTVKNISFPLPPYLQPVFDRGMPENKMVVGILDGSPSGDGSFARGVQ